MASASEASREESSQADSPFIVLHEAKSASRDPNNDFNGPIEHNSTPATATAIAPPSPSVVSSVNNSLEGPASSAVPRAEREKGKLEKARRGGKLDRRNAPRQQVPDDQRNPDNWSFMAHSPGGAHSPVQGPHHARQGSYSEHPGALTFQPANQYQGPRHFNQFQRPHEDDMASNGWNPQFGAPAVSPSAMTFDGHFPVGQPPFANAFMPPDMARGPSSSASFSPPFIQTNFPGANGPHGPPFGGLPLSGYELLAAKLSGNLGGPPIKPIYRRFEALNHRLMLQLQDELSELEEQLRDLDASDTQARQHPGGILPASRRQESPNPNAPSARTELLTRVGYKICQYHQVITSFREIQELPSPNMPDIQDYRSFLAAGHPVTEEEARFLDATDDLATLDLSPDTTQKFPSEQVFTPMPRSTADEVGFPPLREKPRFTEGKKPAATKAPPDAGTIQQTALVHLMLSVFVAILAPIFTFLAIPSFMGRMTVVLLVGSGVMTVLVQSGVLKTLNGGVGMQECAVAVGAYTVAMAIIAGLSQ
jgi:hypothetical protein